MDTLNPWTAAVFPSASPVCPVPSVPIVCLHSLAAAVTSILGSQLGTAEPNLSVTVYCHQESVLTTLTLRHRWVQILAGVPVFYSALSSSVKRKLTRVYS